MSGRILYITDKYRVSSGYRPAFDAMLNKIKIPRSAVVITDIYNLVDKPLYRKGKEKLWRFDPEKLDAIKAAFDSRIRAIRPTLIVVTCPAVIGAVANGDTGVATLEKMRGGVYHYGGIPTIVTYPITAIHQRVDSQVIVNDDGETDAQEPYRVPQGKNIIIWDWQKVARYYHGRVRKLPPFQYSICRSVEDCYAARDFLADCILVAPDIETGNFPPGITCVGYTGIKTDGSVRSFVIPFFDSAKVDGCFWASEDDHALAASVVRDINESQVLKTFQNGSYDCSYFIRDLLGTNNYLLDSMLLWYSLYMELPKSLDFISSVLLDNYQYWKDDIKGEKQESEGATKNLERYWRYCALDTYNTLFNTLTLLKLLKTNQAMQVNYQDTLLRAFSGLKMSMRGVRTDKKRMDYHRAKLLAAQEKYTAELRFLIDDPEFNINSPAQKCSLLYDLFGLRERNDRGRYVDMSKPLKAGNAPSAGKIPLKMAKTEHPLFERIIDRLDQAMEPAQQLSNIFGRPDPDTGQIKGGYRLAHGRLRTTYGAASVESTRYNSKGSAFWDGGNLQNIRDEFRDFIVSDPGSIFMDVDYSQSDDVFIAYESQDPEKIRVIESGLDSHAVNGELFFGVPYDRIVAGKKANDPYIVHPIKGIRQNSKRIVHGTNFQMAAMTLYITMGGREPAIAIAEILGYADAATWSQEQLVNLCGKLMLKYRGKYKRLNKKEWYGELERELKTKGALTNAGGITRNFLGDPADNATQREATAFIGQSDTAYNMNRSQYEVDHGWMPKRFRDGPNPDYGQTPLKMDWQSHGFGFHLQNHDNFVTQHMLDHPRWKEGCYNLLQVMNRPIIIHGREVRVKIEASFGFRWSKKMIEWKGDIRDLDDIVNQLREQEKEYM